MKIAVAASLALSVVSSPRSVSASSCESLSRLVLPHTRITLSQAVAPGDFLDPKSSSGPPAALRAIKDLPAFCRVTARISPATDSDIEIEIWMPMTGWNGKFEAVGNGGWTGQIPYPSMGAALRQGYATSGYLTQVTLATAVMQASRWDILKRSSILVIARCTR